MSCDRCHVCGAELSAGVDFCHRCLLGLAMKENPAGTAGAHAAGVHQRVGTAAADRSQASCPSCGKLPGEGETCQSCAATLSLTFEDDLRVPGHLLLGTLGSGGMGKVYLAEDTDLRRRAAIKVMKDELLARPSAADRFLACATYAAMFPKPWNSSASG
ncbi:MAG: hypothetical protein ACE5ID_08385 [Acidobacteriota bacterium]